MDDELIKAARKLVDAVEFDCNGAMGKGGHGGLTSNDTIRAAGALRLVLSRAAGIDIPRLPVGTPVTKVLGYPFPGAVVAAFHTLAGHERFVVEATGHEYRGMLPIFNGDQLRATTEGRNDG